MGQKENNENIAACIECVPSFLLDYIQCPYCQRRFNENAAERHIKFCQEQAARMPQKGKVADVKKPPARTQVAS